MTWPEDTDRQKSRYRHKSSWYQDEAEAARMRAAFVNTRSILRHTSLSEFINAAILEKVTSLEAAYNGGQPWQPLGAREIPQGKPAPLSRPVPHRATQRPPERYLADLISKVRRSLADELGKNIQVNVFEGGSGNRLEAYVEVYDRKRKTSMLRHYEVFHAADSIEVRTSSGVAWERKEEGPSLLGFGRPGKVQDLGAELGKIIEQTRTQAAADFRGPLSGEVKVLYSPDGPDTLVEASGGDEPSTIRCYGLNTATSELYVRVARNVMWEDSDSIPFDTI